MEKSHVSMEQHICIVCAKPYDTGAILLDKNLKPSMERNTVTALSGMCPEHQKMFDDGYVALVECDPSKTVVNDNSVKNQDAYRTGTLLHIKREAFGRIFKGLPNDMPMAFIPPEVTERLQQMMKVTEQ